MGWKTMMIWSMRNPRMISWKKIYLKTKSVMKRMKARVPMGSTQIMSSSALNLLKESLRLWLEWYLIMLNKSRKPWINIPSTSSERFSIR